jgi:predicted RNase H-like nuclease (RuvC/YqgF family)
METEVRKWLASNNLEAEKLISKWKLPSIAVLEACELVYAKIVNGENIKKISIGWKIKELAEAIAKRKDVQDVKNLKTARETIASLNNEISELKNELFTLKNKRRFFLVRFFKWVWRVLNTPLWGRK